MKKGLLIQKVADRMGEDRGEGQRQIMYMIKIAL